ncbi:hypothetical protein C1X05_14730 [Laceyella sacchari]|uniref:REase associating with pPIWI RE domain-containing protein n=2 Tax=Laceyella TaxID=292635 RepID=A0AA45WPP0_9BACL|nr:MULTISPECIES: hypothetical protein [Laceyella]AUS09956.1 hypothetical protein C1X05_14730 [Laceyella sacchari]PRZ12689.1 hypothetical protein CLV36_11287 [Laceyella sediminis]SMP22583.1 hypothetical protein SAMN06265361_10477 [Laceyella tengchongensis]
MDVTKLLKDLAIGIIHYEIQSQKSTLPPLPLLPQPLQISWNQLTMECIKKGICPPKNLQEFVAWLTTPIEEWEYFGEKWSELGWRGCLVEDLAPTELSYDLSQGAHEAPELEDHTYAFNQLRNYCKEINEPQLYSNIRLFLCENPIINDISCLMDIDGIDTKSMNWVRGFYEPIPSHCIKNNRIILCKHCAWPLKWKNGQLSCLDDLCKKAVNDFLNIDQNQSKPVGRSAYQTTFSAQRAIVRPEVALLPLFEQVKKHPNIAHYEFWPQFDSFDLYLVFKNGKKWAIDMKDYHRPKELANELNQAYVSQVPEWDRFIYLFPNHRKKIDRFYMENFLEKWDKKSKPEFTAMFVDEFVAFLERGGPF